MNQKELITHVSEKTGLGPTKVKRALKTVLQVTSQGLKYHGCVDLGRLGKLKAKKHPEKRYICMNLKQGPNIRTKYTKPTIRLHSKLDLSDNPQPTIVHKNPKPKPISPIVIPHPRFRGRPIMPRRIR
jgi:nucleoid DNA-binding protein